MNRRYTLKHRGTGDIVVWTLKAILEEINRDRSNEWTDYDESDWKEGLEEWTDYELLGTYMESSTELYVNRKERIASILFDYDGEDYERPHEEDCHTLAEQILQALGMHESFMTWHRIAEEEGYYATTGWAIDDVREMAEDMTDDQIVEFLQNNGSRIVECMVGAGWEAIDVALSMEGYSK